MAFVKLDTGILDSTLWLSRDERDVFITALLMAEPYELTEPAAQIAADSLALTGFTVPAGWYGFVRAAGPGIARRALVPVADGIQALVKLGSPDEESRTPDFEGRRLIRVDGGFIVLNFMKYREKDNTAAARAKRYRDRLKQADTPDDNDTPSRRDVTGERDVTRDSSLAEADAELEAEKQKQKTAPKGDVLPDHLNPQLAADFRALRTKLRAPITKTALDGIRREAEKAGITLADALRICCERGWRGFKADWLHDKPTRGQGPPQAASKTLAAIQTLQGMKHDNLAQRRDSRRADETALPLVGSDAG